MWQISAGPWHRREPASSPATGRILSRGAEIYGESVLLYGLGSFFFQNRGLPRYPPDARAALGLDANATPDQVDAASFDYDREDQFWDAIVVESCWRGKRVQKLTVHPIALSHGTSLDRRGLPRLTQPADGRRILGLFAGLCQPYGTRVRFDGATAVIEP